MRGFRHGPYETKAEAMKVLRVFRAGSTGDKRYHIIGKPGGPYYIESTTVRGGSY